MKRLLAIKTIVAAVTLAATAASFSGCASAPPLRLSNDDVKASATDATKKFLNEVDFIPVDEYGKPVQRKYANGSGIVDANGQPVYTQYRIRTGRIENTIPFSTITSEQLTYTITETLRDTRRAQPTDGANADLELTGRLYKNNDWFFIRLRAKCLRPLREKQAGDYLVEKTYEVKPNLK
ncbi:MAG: hypothetical protein LBT53_02845 [Puniceicoccales bacterium]|jgi:hypothetical protein|nr:hypothetical protein [Puniceicoccales bacterium]